MTFKCRFLLVKASWIVGTANVLFSERCCALFEPGYELRRMRQFFPQFVADRYRSAHQRAHSGPQNSRIGDDGVAGSCYGMTTSTQPLVDLLRNGDYWTA
jgi:hypothetical protein